MRKHTIEKIVTIALIIWAVIMAAMTVVVHMNRSETTAGDKNITIVVVHGDESQKTFTISTSTEYLGEAVMEDNDLIVEGEYGPYGLFIISVDGESASDVDHTYWCISQDGVDLMVGADSQPICDKEHYEFTLTSY